MAKKSYGEKLLSSAVHQVGRDLGKTISNQLFGDAHATPVRHIKSSQNQQLNLSSLPTDEMIKIRREQREIESEQRKQKIKTWVIILVLVLGSMFAAILEL